MSAMSLHCIYGNCTMLVVLTQSNQPPPARPALHHRLWLAPASHSNEHSRFTNAPMAQRNLKTLENAWTILNMSTIVYYLNLVPVRRCLLPVGEVHINWKVVPWSAPWLVSRQSQHVTFFILRREKCPELRALEDPPNFFQPSTGNVYEPPGRTEWTD